MTNGRANLPPAECIYGYTVDQVETILGSRTAAFSKWFRGQTGSICDGRHWNHETSAWELTGCGPHGFVIYETDLARFIEGGKVND